MKRVVAFAIALALAMPLPAVAQKDKKRGAQAEAARKSPYGDFAQVTEGATLREGFFDTYQKGDKLLLAVPAERLGEDFLLVFEVAQGIGAAGLFGGTMLNIFEGNLVALERYGDRVFLLKRPHRYVAPPNTPERAAVELTYGSSVLESAKIESIRGDSALIIDVYDWLVSDLSNVGQRVRFAVSRRPGEPGSANFDRSRSYLESVKAYADNVNFRAKLTFGANRAAPLRTVPDGRYIPIAVHHTFARLPQDAMTPRLGDDRVGYFMTVHKDYSRDDTTYFMRYVNRWRLEPGERVGDLYRPVKPIVYYLDRTIPDRYRGFIAEGVEAWNKAFEKAGWKDAVRAELLPEDADAEDLRYATIRWNVSDQRGYGAIGPSIVDPRTGEILDADILIEAEMVLGFQSNWRSLAQPTALLEAMLDPSDEELEYAMAGGELPSFGAQFAAHGTLLRTILAARGGIEPNEPVPMEYVGQALKWVTMHEVGHTLGLRHNFGSSRDTPRDRLHDRFWAEERGVTGSVMDYHAPNVARETEVNGYYYSPAVGSYDEWIISYGYTRNPERAKELAREAGLPGHAYGTDVDAYGPGALDPTVNTFDLSSDPLGWGKDRVGLIDNLFGRLPERVLTDNSSYSDLTSSYLSLLGQYASALAPAIKYIGGQYYHNTRVGDLNDMGPFRPVPAAEQREALAFITQTAFAEDAFEVPRGVLAQFGPNRWIHWGSPTSFNGRLDYPFYEQVISIQSRMLNLLTHPYRLARIRDAELKFGSENVVTIPELFADLTQAIWSEVWTSPGRNIAPSRRDLQRVYIDRLTQILTDPPARMPADARSVARVRLRDLGERIGRRLAPPYSFDDYTYAHLAEAGERIEKALAAGLEVERRR